jgi:hypothetical protein
VIARTLKAHRPKLLTSKFFWKQQQQLVKTTSFFSPRNRAAFWKLGAVAPRSHKLFLQVVMVVSFLMKLILIYIPAQARAADFQTPTSSTILHKLFSTNSH